MNDNKQLKDEEHKTDEDYTGKTYAYIELGLMAGAALFFGLSFTVMGIYSLIASILLSLASITFINLQKKKYDFKWLIYIKIVAYIIFAVIFLFFAGGILWSGAE